MRRSYVDVASQPNFWIRSEDKDGKQLGGPHTPDFEKAARTEESHHIALKVAKALAVCYAGLLAVIRISDHR